MTENTIPKRFENVLALIVGECRTIVGDQGYPFNKNEQIDSLNVQKVLRFNGHKLSLGDACGVWSYYSGMSQAGWLAGAETADGAFQGLVSMCQRRLIKSPSEVLNGRLKSNQPIPAHRDFQIIKNPSID